MNTNKKNSNEVFNTVVKRVDTFSVRVLSVWIAFIKRHPLKVLIIFAIFTLLTAMYTVENFKMNTSLEDMISNELPFRKTYNDFKVKFPISETIAVVIDADAPEIALHVRDLMADSLKNDKYLFKDMYLPGGGSFFEKNGLLYASVDELEDFLDKIARIQPLLEAISKDPNAHGFFDILTTVVEHIDQVTIDRKELMFLFDRLNKSFESILDANPHDYQMSWQEIMLGKGSMEDMRRQFIILQPNLDFSELYSGEKAIKAVRALADELKKNYDVRIRLTGGVPIEYDDIKSVQNGTVIAGIISSILVAILLIIGLRSGLLIFASLSTIFIGLIWTTGFAIAFIGSLNLISITFAVLFIGLSDDFSVQFCMRYRELIEQNETNVDAVERTTRGIGSSLLFCALTTALGFYAFIPTAYTGISELGIITGTGMFISMFITVTFLPALFCILPFKKKKIQPAAAKTLLTIPYKYAKSITFTSAILCLASVFLLPELYFDINPLNLSNQKAESVLTTKELFSSSKHPPETSSIVVKSADEANKIAERLNSLQKVSMAVTISDFVPDKQTEKIETINDIALFIPSQNRETANVTYEQQLTAIKDFNAALRDKLLSNSNLNNAETMIVSRLHNSIERFINLLEKNHKDGEAAIEKLDKSVLFTLKILLSSFQKLLLAAPFDESDLPQQLKRRYVSEDGYYRIEVYPEGNINYIDALKSFVAAVRSVAPEATDYPVVTYEAGRVVVKAFKQATMYAVVFITLLLLFLFRNLTDIFLILVPFFVSVLFTAALSVLFNVPLNFANIIIVPLLLGFSVNGGIHFIHRFHTEPPADGNILDTSTAKGVLYSYLTTIASFASLAFSPHNGTASMGVLLVISMALMLLCTLIVLPAMIKLFHGYKIARL